MSSLNSIGLFQSVLAALFQGAPAGTNASAPSSTQQASGDQSSLSAQAVTGLPPAAAQNAVSQLFAGALGGSNATSQSGQTGAQTAAQQSGTQQSQGPIDPGDPGFSQVENNPGLYMQFEAPELDGLVDPLQFENAMKQIKGGSGLENVTDQDKMKVLQQTDGGLADQLQQLNSFRPDISFADGVNMSKALGDQEFPTYVKVLQARPDIQPQQVEDMQQQVSDAFSSFGAMAPQLTQQAMQTGAQLLMSRQDIKPDELGQMFASIGNNAHDAGDAMQAISMSGDLLQKRQDIKPQDVGSLYTTISKQMPDGSSTTQAFGSAVSTLESRSDLNPEQEADMFTQVRSMYSDPQKAANAFGKANTMLTQNQGSTPQQVLQVLKQDPTNGAIPGAAQQTGGSSQNGKNNGSQNQSQTNNLIGTQKAPDSTQGTSLNTGVAAAAPAPSTVGTVAVSTNTAPGAAA